MINKISIKTKLGWVSAFENRGKIFKIKFGKVKKQSKNRILRNLELQEIEVKKIDNLNLDFIIKECYKPIINTVKGEGTNLQNIFIQKTDMLDKIRKENWRETFPELAEVLND